MALTISGLHHVTAVTGRAAQNVEFYTRVLGLRLVKKTVNQDDVSAYHLFYGDEKGSAGTELTFFDWPQSAPNRPGTGSVLSTGLRVPNREALEWWAQRFDEHGVSHREIIERANRATLDFADAEGQALRLVADDADGRSDLTWDLNVPHEYAIRGLGPVLTLVRDLEPTVHLLTNVMGWEQAETYQETHLVEGGTIPVTIFRAPDLGIGNGAGRELHVAQISTAPRGFTGTGGVHHIAFRAATPEDHRAWQEKLAQAGYNVTPVIDRFYFKSIYFREPGGVLFEIATDGPGFATDEDAAHLGERLSLPPFLEPRREQIEAGLQPLPTQNVAQKESENA